MIYEFKFRGIREEEIYAECPCPLDADELDLHLDAFVEDIRNIQIVIDAEREGAHIKIRVRENSELETLKTAMKPLFQSESGRCLKVESMPEEE